jgi:hypothetical protein
MLPSTLASLPPLVALPCPSQGFDDNDDVAAALAEVVAFLVADFLKKLVVTAARGIALGGVGLSLLPLWSKSWSKLWLPSWLSSRSCPPLLFGRCCCYLTLAPRQDALNTC